MCIKIIKQFSLYNYATKLQDSVDIMPNFKITDLYA